MTRGRLKCWRRTCYEGVQLAVDITLRSVLTCQGEAHAHAADTDGAMLTKARADKGGSAPRVGHVRALQIDGNWRTVE